ncbi:phosphatase PAP2 family protein [Citricoccus nitrophenolicus]|uniref:PAP2 superfamily protein n=1 Tax=Citricoccus muralis TaxID=169134 RepID=A0A3D9LBJ0_9MICC|nr:phosphatase PAP2 family protein [Citricoccus muralis]REE03741.1 PAP2 superfamily protein [Citricoccus muralis]
MSQRIDVAGRSEASEVWPRKRLYPLARLLTEALSPFTVVAVLLTVVALLTDPHWVRSAVITVVPIAVVPQGISLYLTHRGLASDKFIRHRRQRHLFYALTLGSVLLGTALVFVIPTSMELRVVSALSVGTLLAVMAINTRIKISIHALIAAVAAVVLPAMLSSWVVLVLAVLGWAGVTWSRLYLDRHQVSDVVLGSILGGFVGVFFLILV